MRRNILLLRNRNNEKEKVHLHVHVVIRLMQQMGRKKVLNQILMVKKIPVLNLLDVVVRVRLLIRRSNLGNLRNKWNKVMVNKGRSKNKQIRIRKVRTKKVLVHAIDIVEEHPKKK